MGKRYRSLRKETKMNLAGGKAIHWHGFRYPPKDEPDCTDEEIIQAIENKPGFGHLFWEEQDPDKILINPEAVPPDCEAAHLQAAAQKLARMGINVNPKLLATGEKEPEAPQLPTKTSVRTGKKDELQAMIEKFGWDIDPTQTVPDLKKAILAKIEESSD